MREVGHRGVHLLTGCNGEEGRKSDLLSVLQKKYSDVEISEISCFFCFFYMFKGLICNILYINISEIKHVQCEYILEK